MHQDVKVQALEKVHCSCLNVSETVFTATVLMQKIIIIMMLLIDQKASTVMPQTFVPLDVKD